MSIIGTAKNYLLAMGQFGNEVNGREGGTFGISLMLPSVILTKQYFSAARKVSYLPNSSLVVINMKCYFKGF